MNTVIGIVSIVFSGALSEIALKLIGALAVAYAAKHQVKRNLDQRHDLIRLAEIGKEVELKSGNNSGYLLQIMELVNLAGSEQFSIDDVRLFLTAFSENVNRNKKGHVVNVKWLDLAADLGFEDDYIKQAVNGHAKLAEKYYRNKKS